MDQKRAVWVAEVADRGALARLIRAALLRGVAPVDLEETDLGPGVHVLQIRLRGEAIVVLAAELAGETATGSYALRLAPLDVSHEPELIALAEGSDWAAPSTRPMSTSASAIFDSEPPLIAATEWRGRFAPTSEDPEVVEVESDELEASVLFDPEAALISRAPSRPAGSGPEDSLTIPLRALLMPAAPVTSSRPSGPADAHGPATISHLSFPSSIAALSEGSVSIQRDGTRESEGDASSRNDDFTLTPTVPMDVAAPRTVRRTNNHGIVVVGRVIANRYRIESLVGAGAIGAVYKASHVDLPRTFAIKVLHPHYRTDPHLMTSFRTEARAASLLDHPNVTVVHDFGEEADGLVYIVMEYLAGENLQTILDEERRLTPRRTIDIMLQVCAALSAAHERGIIHRDVKPDNIMLVPARDDEGVAYELVKVCDFGIAALESAPDEEDDEWTAGTPEYMAPEQAAGRSDARTDVYACGIVLYEMLTGRPPFVGDGPVATLGKHKNEQARPPSELVPDLPRGLEAIILRAIEKEPELRFATVRELRLELKRLR